VVNQLSGMDIGQVRNLSRQLDRESNEIRNTLAQLSSQLESAPWKGRDRERFVGEWKSRHVAALQRVADGLASASRHAAEHANRQEAASRV
jgi:uncharacterized protein YukE